MAKSYKYNRIKKAGTLEDARLKLWNALEHSESIMLSDSTDDATTLKAIHATVQAVGAYAKLYELTELEQREELLEENSELAKK